MDVCACHISEMGISIEKFINSLSLVSTNYRFLRAKKVISVALIEHSTDVFHEEQQKKVCSIDLKFPYEFVWIMMSCCSSAFFEFFCSH